MKVLSRCDLQLAAECVAQLEGSEAADIYAGLCHVFPVLVRNAGLCQALAFHCDKATGDTPRAQAHHKLLEHVARVLEVEPHALLSTVQNAETTGYFHMTRRVLSAFVFFKRFAVSILKKEAGDDT